jgi:hypothetical protein
MYYTYAYLREDGTPYYIGKGKGARIYKKSNRCCPPPKDKSNIIILKKNLTEEEAFRHEVYMIAVFGRKDLGTGTLRNLTDGGEGKAGCYHSEETKRKISEAVKGNNHPLYGIKHSQETRNKMSKSLKGRVIDDVWKTKMSESHKGKAGTYGFMGKKHDEETIKQMKNRKWWNNGKINKHCEECTGSEWSRGMIPKTHRR